jgi:single-strand selective monofunctional uracil DNA glycosylase
MTDIGVSLLQIEDDLGVQLESMKFSPPVETVYNPLVYAREPHRQYVLKYGNTAKRLLFVGMNPGPFGMAQTGVPFGDKQCVKEFLCIFGEVTKPEVEHPRRPVNGFACARREVSGSRLWGWVERHCHSADNFFEQCYVHNYCPLLFIAKSGRNVTPPQLKPEERKGLVALCDDSLLKVIKLLDPKAVVGVGHFAASCVARVLKNAVGMGDIQTGCILHPSPASPLANKQWAETVEKQLNDMQLWKFIATVR